MGRSLHLLTGFPYRRELRNWTDLRRRPMVQTSSPSSSFKLTRLIGGKLRALYNEEVQPCSSRIADLLETLALKVSYREHWPITKQPEQGTTSLAGACRHPASLIRRLRGMTLSAGNE